MRVSGIQQMPGCSSVEYSRLHNVKKYSQIAHNTWKPSGSCSSHKWPVTPVSHWMHHEEICDDAASSSAQRTSDDATCVERASVSLREQLLWLQLKLTLHLTETHTHVLIFFDLQSEAMNKRQRGGNKQFNRCPRISQAETRTVVSADTRLGKSDYKILDVNPVWLWRRNFLGSGEGPAQKNWWNFWVCPGWQICPKWYFSRADW